MPGYSFNFTPIFLGTKLLVEQHSLSCYFLAISMTKRVKFDTKELIFRVKCDTNANSGQKINLREAKIDYSLIQIRKIYH